MGSVLVGDEEAGADEDTAGVGAASDGDDAADYPSEVVAATEATDNG